MSTSTSRSRADKPGPVFNLDTLEREGEAPGPFNFVVGGKRFVVEDLQDVDWQDLIATGVDPKKDLALALGEDQYAKFEAIRGIPGWKLSKLVEQITQHFGLAGPGEGNASSGS